MANELVIHYPPGATLYAQLFDATGNVWNGSAFAAPGSASWTDYDIAMTEVATATGVYRASMPAAAAGSYGWVVRKQAGGSPAVSDIAVGAGKIEWSGTAEVTLTSRASAVDLASTNTTVDDIFDDVGDVRSVVDSIYLLTGTTGVVLADNAITAAKIAADAIGSSELAATAAAEIAAAVIAGGAGTYSYSDTVDDGSGNLLDGVFIQCATDTGFTNIVSTATTNSLGAFTVYDDVAGTHYLRLQFSGITFTDQTVTLA